MIKVGVYIDARRDQGGTYQYSLAFVRALLRSRLPYFFFLFALPTVMKEEKGRLKESGWRVVDLEIQDTSKFEQIKRGFAKKLGVYKDPRTSLMERLGMDLVLFPNANDVCLSMKAPYVACIHDLQHRLNPQFPEVSSGGRWHSRERLFSGTVTGATRLIAESRTGKEQIRRFYDVDSRKISVLPYVVPPYLQEVKISKRALNEISRRYKLPEKFIYYPAQFWPHKNHQLIIKALGRLREKGVMIEAVFVGSKKSEWGVYEEIMALARRLKVAKQIKVLGYVADEEAVGLYKLAIAMVMPTWFGPSNIPPLEAFYLGCPVITSDIEGIREQVGKAGLLTKVTDDAALARAIEKIMSSEKLRKKLIMEGKKKVESWGVREFAEKLGKIVRKEVRELGIKEA